MLKHRLAVVGFATVLLYVQIGTILAGTQAQALPDVPSAPAGDLQNHGKGSGELPQPLVILPGVDIGEPGGQRLTEIHISPDLNCAVNHADDSSHEFYGDTACGTLIAADGTLYGPADIPAGGDASPRTPFTTVSQTVAGSGTVQDPKTATTVVLAGILRLTQTDTYTYGLDSFVTAVTVENTGTSPVIFTLYRAGDCYLQDSDIGFGSTDPFSGAVRCVSATTDSGSNTIPGDRFVEWRPLTQGPDTHTYEAEFWEIWARIGAQQPFPDTDRGNEFIDNGAGISWTSGLLPAEAATYSHRLTVSSVPIDDVAVETAPVARELQEHNDQSHDPVGLFSGDFRYSFTDVAIAGRGLSPAFVRSYSSADTRVASLGPGWTHNYAARLRRPSAGSQDFSFVGADGNTDTYTHNPDDTFSPPPATFRTLVLNANGTYTATEMDNSSWTFDAAGNLTAITDRFGNASTLGYNGQGELISVSDPAGRGSLSLAYTAGLLTSVTDWATPARTVTYQYDANGRLWKLTDRENQTTTFGYDVTSQRLTTITDARGNVAVTMTYDAQGRVQTQKDAQGLVTGATTIFAYVVNGDGTRDTTVTYPATSFEPSFAPSVTDTHNSQGWLTQRISRPTSSEVLSEAFTYDATGNQTSITDARGFTTNLCYDVDYAGTPIAGSRGNLTRSIAPAPTAGADRPATLFAYDALNNPTQVVAPKGVPSGATATCATDLSVINTTFATDIAYNASGALLLSCTSRFTDPDSGPQIALTKLEYGDSSNPGLLTRVIPPRGNTTPSPDYTYATTMTYGATGTQAGMLVASADALGNTTTYEYDAVGRLVKVVDPLGNAAGGVQTEHATEFAYDDEDRVRFQTSPAPQSGGSPLVTELRYDAVGNRTAQIDANGQVTTYAYDERDGLFQVKESPLVWTDPAVPPATVVTTEYAYDPAGNLTRMTRAKGDSANERATDYAFDGRGLVRRETQYPSWPTTTPTLIATSAYDPNGNPLTLVDPLGQTTTSSYDRLNRLVGIDYSSAGTADVTNTFDANGNRSSMADGTGATTYAYDELNRLMSVTSPGPKTVGYRYDLDGNRTQLIYPDGTAVDYVLNKASQLTSLQDWASRQVSYAYWPDGALKTATNPDASVATYAYDNARRVTDILHDRTGVTIGQYAYTLDAVGNVTGLQDGGTGGSTYASVVQADGPSAYWRLGESTGTTADDVISSTNGTYVGGYTLGQTGAISDGNPAVLLNGSTGYVDTNRSVSLASNGRLTVELWVKWTTLGTSTLVFHGNNQYDFQFTANGGDLSVTVWDSTGGTRRSGSFGGVFPSTGVWYHVVVVLDDVNDTIDVYSQGSLNEHLPGAWSGSSSVISDDVEIGRRTDTANQYVSGVIDEVAIYDHALTAEQVAAHYAARNPGVGGQSTTYGLDRLYRLTSVSGPDGDRTYGYDPVGNRTSLVAGATTTYAYDRADRITGVQGPPVPGSSTRPPTSNDAGWTSSANAYASDNTYATAAPAKNKTKTVSLGTFGFDSTIPANATITGVTVTVEWKVSTTNSVAVLGAQGYVNGSPVGSELVNTAEPTADTSQSFSVPGLTRAQLLNGAFTVRVRATRGGSNTAFTASLDAVSVAVDFTAPATVTLTSNANGNLVAKGSSTFSYDQANRLVSATVAGVTETYTYDGDGVRFTRTVGAGPAIRSVSDVNTSLPITLDDGTRKYVWGLGLAYATSGTPIEVYHTDRLGSVRAITDATGAVTATYRTDEYGVATASTGSSGQPFTFAGEPRDATGLSYLRARYYDPSIGRFMSRDEWPGTRASPQTLNRFPYAGNGPTTDTDPSGHCVDPGGPGIRYCIDRFIPGPHAVFLDFGGDNRMPEPYGGSFRIRQLISNGPDGSLVTTEIAGVTSVFGQKFDGVIQDCGAAATSRVKGGRSISVTCRGANGLLPFSPEIFHLLQIGEDADGMATIEFLQSSLYPSLEIWQYGPNGTDLVYVHDARGRTILDLPSVEVIVSP